MSIRIPLAMLASALSVSPPASQPEPATPDPGATPRDVPCHEKAYQQFDFWLGDWKVHTPDGKLAGYNRVERILDGCAIRESYRSPKGFRGTSLNTYDPKRKRWHQTWVDNQGLLLELDGAYSDGRMVMSGETRDHDGVVVHNRITWSLLPDGGVRQVWEIARGDSTLWEVSFDGFYRSE